MKIEKIVIIGGGPTGLASAIYNARAGLEPLVIEGSPAGGQLMLTTEVENYPGFEDGILGPELIEKFKKQATRFQTRFLSTNVAKIDTSKSPFTITMTDNTTTVQTQSILIATGADAMWLNLPSEQRLRGKGVSACATCDGFFFKNKIVGIVGGGDTAMEEALTLTHFAEKVYVIHRRDSFRASKIMQERVLNHPKIEVIWNSAVEEVLGEQRVEGVKLRINNEEIKNLELQGLFVAIGHIPSTKFLQEGAILLDEKKYVLTSSRVALEQPEKLKEFDSQYQYATNIRGIFAAGDVIDPHYRQAATAVGMGVAAALEVERYLLDCDMKS